MGLERGVDGWLIQSLVAACSHNVPMDITAWVGLASVVVAVAAAGTAIYQAVFNRRQAARARREKANADLQAAAHRFSEAFGEWLTHMHLLYTRQLSSGSAEPGDDKLYFKLTRQVLTAGAELKPLLPERLQRKLKWLLFGVRHHDARVGRSVFWADGLNGRSDLTWTQQQKLRARKDEALRYFADDEERLRKANLDLALAIATRAGARRR